MHTPSAASSHCVTARGAVGDGRTLNTRSLQTAIDAATAAGGGGHVVVPPGVFMTGTLHLRSNLHLELAPGAVLLGSPRIEDYEDLGGGFRRTSSRFICWSRRM
jgi:polygalacturonase